MNRKFDVKGLYDYLGMLQRKKMKEERIRICESFAKILSETSGNPFHSTVEKLSRNATEDMEILGDNSFLINCLPFSKTIPNGTGDDEVTVTVMSEAEFFFGDFINRYHEKYDDEKGESNSTINWAENEVRNELLSNYAESFEHFSDLQEEDLNEILEIHYNGSRASMDVYVTIEGVILNDISDQDLKIFNPFEPDHLDGEGLLIFSLDVNINDTFGENQINTIEKIMTIGKNAQHLLKSL